VDILAPVKAFDRLQQRVPPLAFAMAVVKKYGDDGGGSLSALIAYRAFFSLFPLLLILTTVLGYVLQDDPQAQRDVLDSVLGQFPVIGDDLRAGSLTGSGVAFVVGLAAAIWAGLGITLAAQNAMGQVWAVPMRDRPDVLMSRVRGLGLLVLLGALNVLSTGVSGLVSGGLGGAWVTVAGLAVALLVNLVLFGVTFRLLTADAVATRDLALGIVLAAVGWLVLQSLGGIYVSQAVRSAGPTYGTFALVIGLLAWVHLGAVMVVLAAETNAVRVNRLWPRSLFGAPRPEDREALAAIARIEERHDEEHIEVTFDDPEAETPR
jgi:membrane protein